MSIVQLMDLLQEHGLKDSRRVEGWDTKCKIPNEPCLDVQWPCTEQVRLSAEHSLPSQIYYIFNTFLAHVKVFHLSDPLIIIDHRQIVS